MGLCLFLFFEQFDSLSDIFLRMSFLCKGLNLDIVTSIFEFGYVKLLVSYVTGEKPNDDGRDWFSNIFQVLLN